MIKKPIGHFSKLFNFTCPFCNKKEKTYCREDNHVYCGDYILFQIEMYYCIVKLNNKIEIYHIYSSEYEDEDLLYSGYIDSSDKDNLVKNMVNTLDAYLNNMVFL